MSGVFRVGGGRLFSVLRVGQKKFKPFPLRKGSACRGTVGSLRMKSHQLMMTGNQCFLVSDSVRNKTAVIHSTLSDMKRGRSW
jgi:hypothetical protein